MTTPNKDQFEAIAPGILSRLQHLTLGQGHGTAVINDTDERLLEEAIAAIVQAHHRAVREAVEQASKEWDAQRTASQKPSGGRYELKAEDTE